MIYVRLLMNFGYDSLIGISAAFPTTLSFVPQIIKVHHLYLPIFGGVLERIPKMNLKETTIALFGIDAMESLLKLWA
jgi:hypothetical protein